MPKVKVTTTFPSAKIKKVMQSDEDVGKISQGAPVVISKVLESFVKDLVSSSCKDEDGAPLASLQAGHLKATINANDRFDFVRDVVAKYSDAISASKRKAPSKDGQTKPKRKRPAAKPKSKESTTTLATAAVDTASATTSTNAGPMAAVVPGACLPMQLQPVIQNDNDDDDDDYD
eukprot:TRINITY_DN6786_c0_g1_i6.p1 TRINITY_DN6786_c0_g1~~TRINITY_DN6786_c0_g1_i6.p1  ORF type:complete len:175 (+),score=40.99 TRINITY_DN6786_c0_g1_i6:110-634(+)